jgi:type I restriction enzyme S subunit
MEKSRMADPMCERSEPAQGRVGCRFKPYPAYKDSGVEWLGEIPAHWNGARLKRLFSVVNGSTPESGVAEYWDGDIPWVTPEDLGDLQDSVIQGSRRRITEAGYRSCGTTLAPVGSLVLSTRAPIGHLAIAGVKLCTNQGCRCLVFRRSSVRRFFYFQLLAAWAELESYGQGSTFKELARSKLEEVVIAEPPQTEQRTIADFLDRETARIDALVAKKERLIELLHEKRTALITRAVTKGLPAEAAAKAGLDPNVPMKVSGVEWLAEIPAHWEVKPLTKYVVEKADYRGKTPEKVASGVFLVTARNVRMGLIDYDCSQEFVAEEDYDEIMRRGLPRKGDILFTTEAPLGNVALVDRDDIALAQRIIRFRMNAKRFDSRFTLFAMMSDYFQAQLLTLSTGSTAEGLKASKLPMLRLLAPPVTEQHVIVDFLDRETAKIDALIAKKAKLIELLQEKRTALITQAVTKGLPSTGSGQASPNVPMKDSGVEWLGKIPAHWELCHLRRAVLKFVDYRGKTPEKAPNGIPLITAGNVKNQKIDFGLSEEFINEDLYSSWMIRGLPEVGDVYIPSHYIAHNRHSVLFGFSQVVT